MKKNYAPTNYLLCYLNTPIHTKHFFYVQQKYVKITNYDMWNNFNPCIQCKTFFLKLNKLHITIL